ncbi:methyltransferase domain-containing protein [Haloferula sp. A504]|uniref:methyltransferase domain-containing protein n=1 Tax=Haloferula sp. A504 TaxID=3373601 RepID=UPI0031C55474|nr:methyltransferase domain-containing protein [Verrucomicrobiaceae bacterium E54]
MSEHDHVMPNGPWQFDREVTAAFDNMLQRSIPQYNAMRMVTFEVGRRFVQPGTTIIDMGCSRGEALLPFVSIFGAANDYIGLEISEPMIEAAREKFAKNPHGDRVTIQPADLRHEFPDVTSSVVLSVLTLQFTPIEYRQRIIRRVFDSLAPGGAFILVEKVLGATSELDDAFVDLFLAIKKQNGYSEAEIDRKRLSLEGVLVPVTARWNEDLLHEEGFRSVDCFWRHLNFAGWVAVKA